MKDVHDIRLAVNGRPHELAVEARRTLADMLRHDLGYTGTHLGCEHGICGACTILVDGEPARSCLMLAVQADGRELTTVEGLAGDGELHPIQQAFHERHALQCGFCTPGLLLMTDFLLRQPAALDDEEALRAALSGNICRCTGYQNIVEAVRDAAARLSSKEA
jgi:aerobic-type carbon monoxide dehydrogenase small subunit (CoxS/CutS family)